MNRSDFLTLKEYKEMMQIEGYDAGDMIDVIKNDSGFLTMDMDASERTAKIKEMRTVLANLEDMDYLLSSFEHILVEEQRVRDGWSE